MASKTFGDPFAGEAQWVMEVAARCLPEVQNIPEWYENCALEKFQGRTAASLVRDGYAITVASYLETLRA